jgi:DNA-binding response OmpR family regulator
LNRILIIDDDSVTLEALPALITSRVPHTVVDTAMTEQDALARVRARPYHLVFLDVRMPSIDGLTFLRRLRAYAKDTPVIVMTAHLDESLEAEVSEVGVYALLPKPAFPDVIIAKAQAALQRTPPS